MYESDNLSKFLDVLFYIKPFEYYVCPSNFTNESLECSQACKTIYVNEILTQNRGFWLFMRTTKYYYFVNTKMVIIIFYYFSTFLNCSVLRGRLCLTHTTNFSQSLQWLSSSAGMTWGCWACWNQWKWTARKMIRHMKRNKITELPTKLARVVHH